MRLRRSRQAMVAWLLGSVVLTGGAQEIPGYPKDVYASDPREMAMVPGYCPYTLVFRDTTLDKDKMQIFDAWKAKVGESFVHMHHYCAGLIKANRGVLLSRDRMNRQFYLTDAIVEYDYVIGRVPDSYVLLPEILTKKGEALVHLDRGPVAVFNFERAIELKPDYWPPYAQLGEYYRKQGDLAKARSILELGLSRIPDSKTLARRLAELGDKPSERR